MEKIKYEILRKSIPQVKLVSLTGQTWYNSYGELINWSGATYIGPSQGEIFYNTSGDLPTGYYMWTGTTWSQITGTTQYVNSVIYPYHNIPLFLNSTADELGGMVEFDGNMEQIEQIVNFTYTQTGNTIQIYSTTNPDKLRIILEQTYTIDWGDGNTSGLTINNGIVGDSFPTISHTYAISSGYTLSISLNTPWTNQKEYKKVTIPKDISVTNPIGTFTGLTIPAYSNLTGQTQDYLYDYDYTSGYTGNTVFSYLSIGQSRISEKKLYGSNTYTGVTTGVTGGVVYSGYTIDNLQFRDYADGYTLITGATSGFTKEEVFNSVLTRNEHFLGFIEDPIIYSDIFVERGKQNVMEKNLRLSEIDNMGELDVYGNGYFNVRKQ